MNKLILLDSNSLIYRAFHALPPLTNSKGQNTGAVFGFVNMLTGLIEQEKPTHIAAAFDLKAPTFRHAMFDGYKATRKPMPDELAEQLPYVKRILSSMKIKILELEGFEADDILGTVAKRFACPTLIVSGDRDCLQLVSESTHVYLTKKGIKDVEVYSLARLKEDGFTPLSFIDFKALKGDASDNIPGIAGIGDVTAKNLIAQYGSLEKVLESADELKGKLAEKIKAGRESAILSKKLATIVTDAPLKLTLDDLRCEYPYPDEFREALSELEFGSVVKRLEFRTQDALPSDCDMPAADEVTVEDENELIKVLRSLKGDIALTAGEDIHLSDGRYEYVLRAGGDLFSGMTFDDCVNAVRKNLPNGVRVFTYDLKRVMKNLGGDFLPDGTGDVMLAYYLVSGGKTAPDLPAFLQSKNYPDDKPAASVLLEGQRLLKKMAEDGLEHLYYDIELPLVKVLFDMERTGFSIDKTVLSDLNEKYASELDSLTQEIYLFSGRNFNINSPRQLAAVLFEDLKLPSGKKNKSGFSVGAEVLNDIKDLHPVVPLVLRYRQISKLKSTYTEGILKIVAPSGRLHTEFRQALTSTGRLSSVEPNLQNIPARDAEGREIRKAFIPSPGNLLVSADYSQIELRLMAHFSGDEKLIQAYKDGMDIHTSTAAEIFGIPPEAVTSEMRRGAKAVNFGIIYGISDWGLANNLSVSPKQAKTFITKYLDTYPKVKEYMDSNVEYAREHGYVVTSEGRRRYIPEIKSPNRNLRAFGERAAMNMPLQGTAADIIKIAMIKVAEALKGKKSKLILQVHDELIVDTTPDELETVKSILKSDMENAVSLSVPLTVNVAVGPNWMEAK